MAQTPYKFHPSTQLYTPTNPPIHIVMHVLQVQQHERILILYIITLILQTTFQYHLGLVAAF